MKKLPKLTMTGIDRKTNTDWIRSVMSTFKGDVELAVLLSKKRAGYENRYPTSSDVNEMFGRVRPGDAIAFHLCGQYAKDVIDGAWTEAANFYPLHLASRIQVNVDYSHDVCRAIVYAQAFSAEIGVPVILQSRDRHFRYDPDLHFLQDCSGGNGIEAEFWAEPCKLSIKRERPLGYAGGLSPENIPAKYPYIFKAASGLDFWIDCETSLRTDDWFDISRAEAMILATMNAHRKAHG